MRQDVVNKRAAETTEAVEGCMVEELGVKEGMSERKEGGYGGGGYGGGGDGDGGSSRMISTLSGHSI